jgi:dipeptidyl aminopeptidase/acylaminoacyl peptidase
LKFCVSVNPHNPQEIFFKIIVLCFLLFNIYFYPLKYFNTMKKIFWILFLTPALSFSQQKLTPETLWKLSRISDPQLSPDGKKCLYSSRSFDLAANKGNTDVWCAEGNNFMLKKILANGSGDESGARWYANGTKILFMSDSSGSNQLWMMNADGSDKRQVTKIEGGIDDYGFSASGNMFWYVKDVKLDRTLNEIYPDLPKATGKVYDDLMMRHWNQWADDSYSHLFVVGFSDGIVNGSPIDIMQGERFDCPVKPMGGGEQIAWSADGKTLAYTCRKLTGMEYARSTNSDIYLYDIESKKTTNLTDGMPGYDVNPVFSPDGKQLIWLSMATATYEADRNRIFLYDFTTKTKREITTGFDYSVESAKWSPDGKKIYFLSGINATQQLFSYDLNPKTKSPLRQITSDIGDHTDFTISIQGKNSVILTSMMSISSPTDLFLVDEKTGKTEQVSNVNTNALQNYKMGKVTKRVVKATDGKDILTWVIYPPDFDSTKKYPTLLYCQGGPQSTVSQFFSYRWNFQLMAANGYIIVAPNRRGLPSFGEAWNREISGDWGGQAMRDLLSAIDEVAKEPYVNKDKLGAVGASFGGYSTYWLAGNHNKRFKAFISHCGVFNLESMYGTTEELWFPDFDLGGPYWKTPQPESYQKFSPHKFVKNWDTPILVIHNEKDFRVPLGQGMEAFTAARVQNIPARFFYFPDEGHWVSKPQNSVLWQRIFFDWLDKYLK